MWYLDFRSTRGQKVDPALARELPLLVGMAQSVHLGLAYLRGVSVWCLRMVLACWKAWTQELVFVRLCDPRLIG